MAIKMTHPVHGTTFAVGAEIEWNKLSGWKVESAPEKVAVPVAAEADAAPEEIQAEEPPIVFPDDATDDPASEDESLSEDLRTQYIAKFGKEPHHRMIESTIRRALAE